MSENTYYHFKAVRVKYERDFGLYGDSHYFFGKIQPFAVERMLSVAIIGVCNQTLL